MAKSDAIQPHVPRTLSLKVSVVVNKFVLLIVAPFVLLRRGLLGLVILFSAVGDGPAAACAISKIQPPARPALLQRSQPQLWFQTKLWRGSFITLPNHQ